MWNKFKKLLKDTEEIGEELDSDEIRKYVKESKKSIEEIEDIEEQFRKHNRLQELSKTGNEKTLEERLNKIGVKKIEKERNKRYEVYFENGIKEDDWLEIYNKEFVFYYFNNEDFVPYTKENGEIDLDEFNRIISTVDKEYEKVWIKRKTIELSFSSESEREVNQGYSLDFQTMELIIYSENYNKDKIEERESYYWVNVDKERVWYCKEKYHRIRTSLIDQDDERFDDPDFEGLWGDYVIYQPVEWLKHEDFTREYTKENVNKVLKWNKVEDVRLETDLGYVDWVTVSEDWKRFNDYKNKFPNHQFKSTKFFRFQ